MFGFRTTALIMGLSLGTAPLINVKNADAGSSHRGDRGHHNTRSYDGGRGGYYAGPRRSSYYSGRHWQPKYRAHHTRHHRHGIGKTGAAILGIGAGLLVANAIDKKARRIEERNYRMQTPYPAPVVYAQTLNAPPSAPQRNAAHGVETPCLQTREYQTTITVGGAQHPAYGTACLMPDGSWQMGQATPEPTFD